MNAKRILLVVLCTALVAMFFLCGMFGSLLGGAAHTCLGERCFICFCISLGEHLPKIQTSLLPAFLWVCFTVLFLSGAYTDEKGVFCHASSSPVFLKVKLSN